MGMLVDSVLDFDSWIMKPGNEPNNLYFKIQLSPQGTLAGTGNQEVVLGNLTTLGSETLLELGGRYISCPYEYGSDKWNDCYPQLQIRDPKDASEEVSIQTTGDIITIKCKEEDQFHYDSVGGREIPGFTLGSVDRYIDRVGTKATFCRTTRQYPYWILVVGVAIPVIYVLVSVLIYFMPQISKELSKPETQFG